MITLTIFLIRSFFNLRIAFNLYLWDGALGGVWNGALMGSKLDMHKKFLDQVLLLHFFGAYWFV